MRDDCIEPARGEAEPGIAPRSGQGGALKIHDEAEAVPTAASTYKRLVTPG